MRQHAAPAGRRFKPRGLLTMQSIHSETFEYDGRRFVANLYPDDSHGAPDKENDGHGEVDYIRDSESMPRGWVNLCHDHRGQFIYNFGAAIVKAAREGWGIGPEKLEALRQRIGKKPNRSQIRAEAVRADMDYLRGYYRNDWGYVGVSVRIIGPDDEPQGEEFENAIWGIEYGSGHWDVWEQFAQELASEILCERRAAWLKALKESRERRYWATRDVTTQGANHG